MPPRRSKIPIACLPLPLYAAGATAWMLRSPPFPFCAARSKPSRNGWSAASCPLEGSRWRGGRYRVGEVGSLGSHRPINCGSQGGPCDPSTKNHAGGTPAASLLRGYHTLLHPRGRKVRTTLPLLSGPSGSAAHPGIPSPTLRKAEVVTRHGDEPSVCPAVFLHPDAEEAVEHCRHSVSEENSSPARHSQPGGSGAAHRRGLHSVSSHPAHDPLRHRSPQRRVDAPKD